MTRPLCVLIGVSMLVAAACGRDARSAAEVAALQPGSGQALRPGAEPAYESGAAARPAALPRIVFLGDSLTAGLGLPRQQSVPSLIQARLNAEGYRYEVVNAGVSGDTSAGGVSRLEWALDGRVEVLVLELGANDGLRGLPVAQMKRNLAEIIARARGRGITVILTGMEAPPNYGPAYTSEFRQAFRDLAREHAVVFVPFFLEGVAGVPSLNLADQMHPNDAGARVIEQTMWRALEPVLEKQDR